MRVFFGKLALAGILLMAAPRVFAGEVVDRLVAAVDNVPILQSDWDHAVALEAFEQGRSVSSYTREERFAVLNRLVDQQLIRAQMGDDHAAAADETEIQQQLSKIRADLTNAQSDSDWKHLLAQYGIDEELLRKKVARELQVIRFIDLRLRPETRIERSDVEDYYTNTLLPTIRKNGGKEESLAQVYPKIEEVLRQQRIDALLSAWLQELHQQSDIQWIGVKAAPAPDTASSPGAGGH